MIWAKRRFSGADYSPYMKLLGDLQLAMPNPQEFAMVARNVRGVIEQDVYVGVPTTQLLAAFDGFEPVSEADLPKEIDQILVEMPTSVEVARLFTLRVRGGRGY